MKTSILKTSYYVKPDFPQVFTGSMMKLEKKVEAEYMDKLRNACNREKIAQSNLFLKAKYSGSSQLKRRAAEYSTASCKLLEELPGGGRGEMMDRIEKQFRDFYQTA
eukprot:GFUD01017559.1.p1 GENE.GFUD01017559.1~~GFUD01017559.1.p1  ORF type:complete len:107 (+),score=43.74 GFUD01017559.1:364-684(+)